MSTGEEQTTVRIKRIIRRGLRQWRLFWGSLPCFMIFGFAIGWWIGNSTHERVRATARSLAHKIPDDAYITISESRRSGELIGQTWVMRPGRLVVLEDGRYWCEIVVIELQPQGRMQKSRGFNFDVSGGGMIIEWPTGKSVYDVIEKDGFPQPIGS